MDISVRYIPTEYHRGTDGRTTASGNKPALCFISDTESRCIINTEDGVKMVILPREDARRSSPVGGYENDEEAVQKFRQFYNVTLKGKKEIQEGVQDLMDLISDPPKDFPQDRKKTKTTKKKTTRSTKSPSSSIIATLSEELKIPSSKIRKTLRAAGMKAPYEDEKAIRKALTTNGTKR